jgi:hypothetical protein
MSEEVVKYGKLFLIIDQDDNIQKMIKGTNVQNAKGEFYDFIMDILPHHAMYYDEQPDVFTHMHRGVEFTETGWYLNGELLLPDDQSRDVVTLMGNTYTLITGAEFFKVDVNITQTRRRLDNLFQQLLEETDMDTLDSITSKIVAEQKKFYMYTGYIYGKETKAAKEYQKQKEWKARK